MRGAAIGATVLCGPARVGRPARHTAVSLDGSEGGGTIEARESG